MGWGYDMYKREEERVYSENKSKGASLCISGGDEFEEGEANCEKNLWKWG